MSLEAQPLHNGEPDHVIVSSAEFEKPLGQSIAYVAKLPLESVSTFLYLESSGNYQPAGDMKTCLTVNLGNMEEVRCNF